MTYNVFGGTLNLAQFNAELHDISTDSDVMWRGWKGNRWFGIVPCHASQN